MKRCDQCFCWQSCRSKWFWCWFLPSSLSPLWGNSTGKDACMKLNLTAVDERYLLYYYLTCCWTVVVFNVSLERRIMRRLWHQSSLCPTGVVLWWLPRQRYPECTAASVIWSLCLLSGPVSLLRPLEVVYLLGLVAVAIACEVVIPLSPWQLRLPFLPLLATSVYCSVGVCYSFVRLYVSLLCEREKPKQLWDAALYPRVAGLIPYTPTSDPQTSKTTKPVSSSFSQVWEQKILHWSASVLD